MGVRDADGHKLGYHPKEVAKWLDGQGMPLHAEIGLTNRCNHHCSFCTLDWITHGNKTLASPVIGKTVQDMKYMGIQSIYLAGEGEPTLHPEFRDIVNGIAHMGMKVAVSTNGQCFNAALAENTLRNISWIRFSVDTISKSLYSKIHGVREDNLDVVLNNIESAVNIKKTLELKVDIGVQVILTPETALTLNELVECMKEIGVDNIQIKPCHNHPSSKHQSKMDTNMYNHVQIEMKDYETDDFKVIVRTNSMERLAEPRTYKRCHGFDFYVLINANGDVVPCNVFYHKLEFVYGNIYNESFLSIWTGNRRKRIIEDIALTNHKHCGDYRCRLDVMNRHLERVKHPERNDEFI
jgi:radical SAM protein with 4Fe4S-binding SPASM domain